MLASSIGALAEPAAATRCGRTAPRRQAAPATPATPCESSVVGGDGRRPTSHRHATRRYRCVARLLALLPLLARCGAELWAEPWAGLGGAVAATARPTPLRSRAICVPAPRPLLSLSERPRRAEEGREERGVPRRRTSRGRGAREADAERGCHSNCVRCRLGDAPHRVPGGVGA